MNFEMCYCLAEYMNDHNKGCFSNKEVACRAFEIFEEVQWAKRNKHLPYSLQEAVKILLDDETEESSEWADNLIISCGMEVADVKSVFKLNMQFRALYYAFYKFYDAVEDYHGCSDESINELDGFVELYPFRYSLDEVVSKVGTWGERCSDALFKKL